MAQQPGERRGRDHLSAISMSLNERQESANAVEHAGRIDAHSPVPIVVCRRAQPAEYTDARVVDDHVHLLEDTDGFLRRLLHPGPVGHVHIDGVHSVTCLLQVLHRFVEMRLSSIRDHDLHAGIGEGARDPQSDAAVATRDEGNLPLDILHGRRHHRAIFRPCIGRGRSLGHQDSGRGSGSGERRSSQELTACARRLRQRGLLRLVRHTGSREGGWRMAGTDYSARRHTSRRRRDHGRGAASTSQCPPRAMARAMADDRRHIAPVESRACLQCGSHHEDTQSVPGPGAHRRDHGGACAGAPCREPRSAGHAQER